MRIITDFFAAMLDDDSNIISQRGDTFFLVRRSANCFDSLMEASI
jgi:hypothetical protein